jgi:DNA-binding NtrC family response regulator
MPREGMVLVVDDDPVILDIISSRMELAGYSVTTACDAWASVVQAEALKLSLVITDIRMPGVGSGVDGYKKIREISKDLPVIFITSMNPAVVKEMLPSDDPKIRLSFKPIDFDQLRQCIKELTGIDREI